MAEDGKFFANIIVGVGVPGEWQGFPVVPRTLETYRALALKHDLRMRELGSLAEVGHHTGDASQDTQTMVVFDKAGAAG